MLSYLQSLDDSNFAATTRMQGGCELPGFSLPALSEFLKSVEVIANRVSQKWLLSRLA
jgi:hypothetical protein